MSLLSSLMIVGVHLEEAPAPLVLPNWAFPAIAAAIFIALGFISWSWRDVANRHSDKTSGSEHSDAGHGHH